MRVWVIAVLVLLLASSAIAQEDPPSNIISNSENWEDVYSVTLYGTLTGTAANFLVSDRHGPLLLNGIAPGSKVWIISSDERPFLVGYGGYAEGRGYEAEEFIYPSINLELARQLPDITKFIVIDNAYGYNAISVAPYAARSRSYVLFANDENVDDIADFLDERTVEELIVYGTVDRDVRDELARFNPETINNDGDRFLNNIEIVRRYQDIVGSKQAILTNGEFIEKEIMSGVEPVLFIGSNNVPEVTRDYIQQSDIQIGVLIGNELVGTATTIRRQAGISVFVKFAQGARAQRGAVSQVEALDMFYLPTYSLRLEIQSIKLNRATGQMEITYFNPVDQAIYFKGTYSLASDDGATVTAGDTDAEFIGGREAKTLVYDVDGLGSGTITADVFVIFGESRNSLEQVLDQTLELEVIDIQDNCEIQVTEIAIFQPSRQTFKIEIENVGAVDCYADVELLDVRVAGERLTFGTQDPLFIARGGSREARIKTTMEEEDIPDNPRVDARIFYGERETSLIKQLELELELQIQKGDIVFYSLLVIIILLVAFIVWRRKQVNKGHHR